MTQVEGELIAALIVIIPVAATAVVALLQSFINKETLKARPTHDEVSTQIQAAVNDALTTNNGQEGAH